MLLAATADTTEAVEQAGLSVIDAVPGRIDLQIDDRRLSLAIVPVAYATGSRVLDVVDSATGDTGRLLVSDRVTADARHVLEERGWSYLDRRGHLRLRAPGVLVDTSIPPIGPPTRRPDVGDPLAGAAGLAVAYHLLIAPDRVIMPTRSGTGFAPSTVSVVLRRVREAGLADADGRPILPELFWALVERWHPRRQWLASIPEPIEAGHDPDAPGWRLTGTSAAAELGAPVVTTGLALDFYLPGPAALTIALRRHGGAAAPEVAAASVAVAPVTAITSGPRPLSATGWPLAHPVAVALDLAQDRARGREILEDWSPPERVW